MSDEMARHLDALRDDHCYITSVDVCCHCGDSECDGIGCIADIDHDSNHDDMERLHTLLREGQAWRVLKALVDDGQPLLTAFMLASETLAVASNQTITQDCEQCGRQFEAQGPCDLTCTACRLTETPGGESDG